MSSRILVTGATGFLGNALTRRLLVDGGPVTVLHRDSASSAAALEELRRLGAEVLTFSSHSDIAGLVAEAAPDTVYHLATKYVRDHRPAELDEMIEANIAFGTHVLESLVGSAATVVTALSYFQFSNSQSAPYSVYSATKQAFAEVSRFYREVKNVDFREVILYDTFGPGDTRDKLIPQMVDALRHGTPMAMGPSRQLLNLLYVDDAIMGFVRAAAADNPNRMTIRAQEPISVGELAAALEHAAGRSLGATFADERSTGDLVIRSGDWPAPLGWSPRTSLADGLAMTWQAATT